MTNVKIGIAQIDSEEGNVEANVMCAMKTIDRLARSGARFVCLPELWNTAYCIRERFHDLAEPVPGPVTEKLGKKALQYGIHIIAGIAERAATGAIYNTAVLIGPDGMVTGKYSKVHLATERETSYFKAGNEYPSLRTDYGPIGIMICYDAGYFPEVARTYALAGVELIFSPMAWGFSYKVNTGKQQRIKLLKENIWRLRCSCCTRAMENTVFLVVANRIGKEYDRKMSEFVEFVGHSMVIAPDGIILSELDENSNTSVVDIELEKVWKRRTEALNPLRDRRPETYKW